MSVQIRRRRVVVTGIGAITPLGQTFVDSWRALLRLESGVVTLQDALYAQGLSEQSLARELELAKNLPCQVAAPVRRDRLDNVDDGEASSSSYNDNRTARFVQFALLAGKQAIQQSNLDQWLVNNQDRHDRQRVGVCMGSGMSSVREVMESYHTVQEKGYRKLSPHFVPKVLSNSAAGRLSIEHGLLGPNHSASTACAAGSHAIGDAMRMIQNNSADVMLAGGAEACIDPMSMAGFCRLRALSTCTHVSSPQQASRPFDRHRDGFVMAEGAAVLVLEELEHARARGAPLLAEMTGYGLSADAHHITAPDPDGRGAEHAMRMALAEANSLMSSFQLFSQSEQLLQVQYVNAHATSTPKGDEIEARVIDRVLCGGGGGDENNKTGNDHVNDDSSPVFVSSTKGATGHLLGAAGALEAAFTVQTLVKQQIPPTLNLTQEDDEETGATRVRFQHVKTAVHHPSTLITVAMNNSFGFGGTNAALVFQRIIE
jgi:3-oxoacyl-[acyl-carrier-protein] synthase II